MVDLRLLKGRLFRSTNGVMFLAAAAFLGTLYLIPLYFQDARGLTRAAVGALHLPRGVRRDGRGPMASRLIYPGSARAATSPSASSASP